MSPIAKMPCVLVSKLSVLTGINSLFFSSKPQFATGPSFMVSPKNGSIASQAISNEEPSLVFTNALLRCHLAEHEVDLALADERHHLVDAIGRGAEFAAPVYEREVAGDGREIE